MPVLASLGRILAEDVYSDMNIPPHANSAMDGYALIAADAVEAGPDTPVRLRVIENLAAGYVAQQTVVPGTAIRIMTGAPVPAGADSVIRFERTEQTGDVVRLYVSQAAEAIPTVLNRLRQAETPSISLTLTQPTLDDVFLQVTGRRLEMHHIPTTQGPQTGGQSGVEVNGT